MSTPASLPYAFVAKIDLPGVDPGSIDIDVDDRTLTVRAERRPEEAQWPILRVLPICSMRLNWLSLYEKAGRTSR